MRYQVLVKGENWAANIEVDAKDAEDAIDVVRDISLYDHAEVKIGSVVMVEGKL